METTIAAIIATEKKISLERAKKKYKTYFGTLGILYSDYKEKTDAILELAGNADCIVTV